MKLAMEWFNLAAGFASIAGLAVSLYTLYRVMTLPVAIRQYSRDQHLAELIDRIVELPRIKKTLPDSSAQDVEFICRTVRMYYAKPFLWQQRSLKRILSDIEHEARGEKSTQRIKNLLQLLRTEVFIR
jgi:hypothetical protein